MSILLVAANQQKRNKTHQPDLRFASKAKTAKQRQTGARAQTKTHTSPHRHRGNQTIPPMPSENMQRNMQRNKLLPQKNELMNSAARCSHALVIKSCTMQDLFLSESAQKCFIRSSICIRAYTNRPQGLSICCSSLRSACFRCRARPSEGILRKRPRGGKGHPPATKASGSVNA